MAVGEDFTLTLDLQDGYRFLVDFAPDGEQTPQAMQIAMDEPEPLGAGSAPNASRVLAAAIGNCLSASALYCLRRAHVDVQSLHTCVSGRLTRNEAGRMRIERIEVKLQPSVPVDQQPAMARCLEIFEDYCVVTESVRGGIDVGVAVEPKAPAQAPDGTII